MKMEENKLHLNGQSIHEFSNRQDKQVKFGKVTVVGDTQVVVRTDDGDKGIIQKYNMSKQFVENPSCLFYLGQRVKVEVSGQDGKGFYILSTKNFQDFSVYKRGENVEIRLTKTTEKGVQFVTNDENLAQGFIYNNQIDWQVENVEYEKKKLARMKMDDPSRIKPARIIREIHSEKGRYSNLICSLKERKPNPWKEIRPGMCMKGSISCGNIGDFTVELENGLLAKCTDANPFEFNKGLMFAIQSMDENKGSITVSNDLLHESYKLEQSVKKYFSSTPTGKKPSHSHRQPNKRQLILSGNDGYKSLLLLPQHIVYGGEAIAMPFALDFIQYFIDKPQRIINYKKYKVIRAFDCGRRALISIDMADYPDLYHCFRIDYQPGIDFKARRLCSTPHYEIMATPGMIGFTDDLSCEKGSNDIINITVDGHDKSLHMSHVYIHKEVDVAKTQDEPVSISQILSPEDEQVVNENELNVIKELLGYAPYLKKDAINRCLTDIYAVNIDKIFQLKLFQESNRNNLHQDFYLAYKKDKKGKQYLLIYNEADFVLNLSFEGNKFNIKSFSDDKRSGWSQGLLNQYKNIHPLVLQGEKLHLVSRYNIPQSYDATSACKAIALQQEVVTSILPGIKKRFKERKKNYGKDYVIMSKYLSYQQKMEKERLSDICIQVPPGLARYGSNYETDNKNAGLKINRTFCEEFLGKLNEDENKVPVYVKIIGEEKPIACFLEDSLYENCCILSFNNLHLNLGDYINKGVNITYRANVRHLSLQKDEIKKFVKEDKLLSKLNEGKLCPPEIDMNQPFAFKDAKFYNVEPGNNQPIAIRKALACKDIFLIQGPPGTGKTSVIVEIVRQLAERGERVLVCSQAHSAVRNVYERLLCTELSDDIGFIDEPETMHGMSPQGHEQFLKNNMLLLKRLPRQRNSDAETICHQTDGSNYADSERADFMKQHDHIIKYHDPTLKGKYIGAIKIIDEFREELHEQADNSLFYATGHLRSLKVVMGTCIGVGMYRSIQQSGMLFDTVIIDEAGKANYGETIVPMRLGKKYILVGDQRQLPPYMDREEVEKFLANEYPDCTEAQSKEIEIEEALSSSLFEDFLDNDNFCKEKSSVLLNYQYRMNPDIGNYISTLFYGGELNNGTGTQNLKCEIEGYPYTVTFYDTRNKKKPYENSSGYKIYNQCEIDIICNEIVPKIENKLIEDKSLTVGIVTPYREQARLLMERLSRSTIVKGNNSGVFTIDSIQGREFDIVVLSFVRSFPMDGEPYKKVGFLDDIRRLNVALSRARKKLILVGNIKTLTCPEAHRKISTNDEMLQPEEVFKRMSENSKRSGNFDMIAKLRNLEKEGKIKKGDVLSDCEIATYINRNEVKYTFKTTVDSIELQFPINGTYDVEYANSNGQTRSVMFAGYDKDRPKWFPFIEARIKDFDTRTITLMLRDGTETKLMRPNFHFLDTILNERTCELEDVWLPFNIGKENLARLNSDVLRTINAELKEGDYVLCQVVGEDEKSYSVYRKGTLGKIMKPIRTVLSVGRTYGCRVGKIFDNEDNNKMPIVIYKLEKF